MLPETMASFSISAAHSSVSRATRRILGAGLVTADAVRAGVFVQLFRRGTPTAHGFQRQGGVGGIYVTANVAPKMTEQMQGVLLAGIMRRRVKPKSTS